jgi:hypothetical protein
MLLGPASGPKLNRLWRGTQQNWILI